MAIRANKTATTKVGLLTIIALAILITTVIWLRGRGLGAEQSFDALFKDVDGMRSGAPVQYMGIRVGFVDDVTPLVLNKQTGQYGVNVKFSISEPNVNIPRGSRLSIQQSGIIGEKFLEISPPRPEQITLMYANPVPQLQGGLPIEVRFQSGLAPVGQVTNVNVNKMEEAYAHVMTYMITRPGYLPPEDPHFSIAMAEDKQPYVLLEDNDALISQLPAKDAFFAIENPLRLKDFLQEQLVSAEALKRTNDKINQLLTPDTIASIQGTLRNSEQLTIQASQVLSQANTLFSSTSKDLSLLANSAQDLTDSIVQVSDNINSIVGDPELKGHINRTAASVDDASHSLSTLLSEPDMKSMVGDLHATTKNASEFFKYLNENDVPGQLSDSVTLMNSSLNSLSIILKDLQSVTAERESMKNIVKNTEKTTGNLNEFSEELNKHFLLFRLLF